MNFNDIFILLGLAIITLIGFAQGTIRLLIALFSFYLAIVLSSLYFRIVGVWLQQRLGTSQTAAPGVAFALILLLSFIVVVAALLYTFRYAETPRGLQVIDRILGAVLGLIMAALVMGTYATIMRFLFVDNDLAAQATFPIVRSFQNDVRSSFVITFMLNDVLPLIFRTLDPVLPDAANVFFNIR